ncbi:hypothetical protein Tco_0248457 [Tanacetum coccineum]
MLHGTVVPSIEYDLSLENEVLENDRFSESLDMACSLSLADTGESNMLLEHEFFPIEGLKVNARFSKVDAYDQYTPQLQI